MKKVFIFASMLLAFAILTGCDATHYNSVDISSYKEVNDDYRATNKEEEYKAKYRHDLSIDSNEIATIIEAFEDVSNNVSYSELNNNPAVMARIMDYEARYGHRFNIASKEVEEKIFGVWQATGRFGWDNTTRIQGDGFSEKVIIFDGNMIIDSWSIWYNPVFVYYTALVRDMEFDSFLNLSTGSEDYLDSYGIVILALNSMNSNTFRTHPDSSIRLILIEDMLMILSQASYHILTKIGEIEIH